VPPECPDLLELLLAVPDDGLMDDLFLPLSDLRASSLDEQTVNVGDLAGNFARQDESSSPAPGECLRFSPALLHLFNELSEPIWLQVWANNANGLFLASNCKQIYIRLNNNIYYKVNS
jgi:hypothetical protein